MDADAPLQLDDVVSRWGQLHRIHDDFSQMQAEIVRLRKANHALSEEVVRLTDALEVDRLEVDRLEERDVLRLAQIDALLHVRLPLPEPLIVGVGAQLCRGFVNFWKWIRTAPSDGSSGTTPSA